MSEKTERRDRLVAYCDDMNRRFEAGEEPTPDDFGVMGMLVWRFGNMNAAKAASLARTRPARDRLAEIIADLHTRLDAGINPDEDEMTFARILEERIEWVDSLEDIRSHLEERP